jgi:hypothetical protein
MEDSRSKISGELAARLEQSDTNDFLDLIVELEPGSAPSASGSRAERIAAQKQSFDHHAGPVERLIQQAGGEVLDRAWINQTLRARLPVRSVHDLTKAAEVSAIDVPHRLERG